MNPLVEAITEMREDDAVRLAQGELKTGTPPVEILDRCREAMTIIGQRFEEGDCFVPELILAGEMLRQISDVVKPQLTQAAEVKKIGRVIISEATLSFLGIGIQPPMPSWGSMINQSYEYMRTPTLRRTGDLNALLGTRGGRRASHQRRV